MIVGVGITLLGVADSIWDVAPKIEPDKLFIAGGGLMGVGTGTRDSKKESKENKEDAI